MYISAKNCALCDLTPLLLTVEPDSGDVRSELPASTRTSDQLTAVPDAGIKPPETVAGFRHEPRDVNGTSRAIQDSRAFSSRSWNQAGIARFSRLNGGRISSTTRGSRWVEIQSLV